MDFNQDGNMANRVNGNASAMAKPNIPMAGAITLPVVETSTNKKPMIGPDPKVNKLMTEDYVLITLFVDNKTPLPEHIKVMENGKERTLRTIGDKWSYLQRSKFGANAQPFYVLIDNEGKPLNKSYSYDEDIDKYVDFLQTGLQNYKK